MLAHVCHVFVTANWIKQIRHRKALIPILSSSQSSKVKAKALETIREWENATVHIKLHEGEFGR